MKDLIKNSWQAHTRKCILEAGLKIGHFWRDHNRGFTLWSCQGEKKFTLESCYSSKCNKNLELIRQTSFQIVLWVIPGSAFGVKTPCSWHLVRLMCSKYLLTLMYPVPSLYPFLQFFLLLSRVCCLSSIEIIMQKVPKSERQKHILRNGKWIHMLPKVSFALSLFLSAAVFHYQCPNQLVKKSETQTTVLKITEFLHKCPTLPAATLGSGLRWDRHTTTCTHTRTHIHTCILCKYSKTAKGICTQQITAQYIHTNLHTL